MKEIPTVKVLDAANIPDKKSFPPRLFIIFLGTTFVLALAATCVFGNALWQETEADDPRKVFARDVFLTVTARIPRFSRNGSGIESVSSKFWSWKRRHQNGREESH